MLEYVSLESGIKKFCLCNHYQPNSNDIALFWKAQKDYRRWKKVLNKSVLFWLSRTDVLLEPENPITGISVALKSLVNFLANVGKDEDSKFIVLDVF